jgi:hypothetical protein
VRASLRHSREPMFDQISRNLDQPCAKLMDATVGNVMTNRRMYDLAPIHTILASGVSLDDVIATLREKSTYAGERDRHYLDRVTVSHLRGAQCLFDPLAVIRWQGRRPQHRETQHGACL